MVIKYFLPIRVFRKYFKRNPMKCFDIPKSNFNALFVRRYGIEDAEPVDVGTMVEVKENLGIRIGMEQGYNPTPTSRENLLQYTPKLEDLPNRTMEDSYSSSIIPLSTDKQLQEKYGALGCRGHVCLGRLMEDIDMFAVWLCHQHVCVPTLPQDVLLPYTFVTFLVDKAAFTDYVIKVVEDIRLSGYVSWVGRTSMEVDIWLEQLHDGVYKKITRAFFLMAARNATNTGPAPVNPIIPTTEEERKIFEGGQDRRKHRQLLKASSLLKVEPNGYEQTLVYNVFKRTTSFNSLELNSRSLPSKCRWMSDCSITNVLAAFPENRNTQNTIFGGYLMRASLEISRICAHIFSKQCPMLVHISDISFAKPISISSFIKITAYIVYTEVNYIQVMTVADILDAISATQDETSNVFYYLFRIPERVSEVLPRTYHETMWYLNGRRKFKYSLNLD